MIRACANHARPHACSRANGVEHLFAGTDVYPLRRLIEPEKPRPYRAWGYPWTTGLALIGSVLFLAGVVAGDTWNSVYALLLLAVSYPVFRLIKWRS